MPALSVTSQIATIPSSVPDVSITTKNSDSALSRFSEIMANGNPVATSPLNQHLNSSNLKSTGYVNFGDAILNKLNTASDSYRHTINEAVNVISAPTKSVGLSDLLHVQISMAQTSLCVELVSNSISKTAQHIDTLTKMQ